MPPTDEEIVAKLNMLYSSDKEQYEEHVETLKGIGYKIYRNSEGKHKVEYNNQYFAEMFGGAFKGFI